ncbi:hypothetical protein [Deinococcus rufus]|uniref:HTH iclR-type domain-containing protein n=1 Tax=Deinococcus rufus TaxID=2136097 RepID=A0ABV7ZB36_9DEIO
MARPRRYGPAVTPGTQLHTVYAALSELPGVPMTNQELSDETGLPVKHCCAYTIVLRKLGLTQSGPADPALGFRPGQHLHWVGVRVDAPGDGR